MSSIRLHCPASHCSLAKWIFRRITRRISLHLARSLLLQLLLSLMSSMISSVIQHYFFTVLEAERCSAVAASLTLHHVASASSISPSVVQFLLKSLHILCVYTRLWFFGRSSWSVSLRYYSVGLSLYHKLGCGQMQYQRPGRPLPRWNYF